MKWRVDFDNGTAGVVFIAFPKGNYTMLIKTDRDTVRYRVRARRKVYRILAFEVDEKDISLTIEGDGGEPTIYVLPSMPVGLVREEG